MTTEEMRARATQMQKVKLSAAMIDLQARHAAENTKLDGRHQNERADLAIAHEKETRALIAKENPPAKGDKPK